MPSEYLFEEIEEEKAGLFSKKALAEKGHVSQGDIASLLELFENAKTFGSLIQVPPKLAAKLPEIEKRLDDVLKYGDLTHASAHVIKPLLQQARLLARQYDAVVANPPYMGSEVLLPGPEGISWPTLLQGREGRSVRLLHPAESGLCQVERLRRDDYHSELDVPVVLRERAASRCLTTKPSTLSFTMVEASLAQTSEVARFAIRNHQLAAFEAAFMQTVCI